MPDPYRFEVTIHAEGDNLPQAYRQLRDALMSIGLGWETERAWTGSGPSPEDDLQEAIEGVLKAEER